MNRLVLCLLLLLGSLRLIAQDKTSVVYFTLEDVIQKAIENSPEGQIAKIQLLNQYWQNRAFKADLLPRLTLNANAPDLNRSSFYNEGTAQIEASSNFNNSLALLVNQNLGLTGGSIFVRSDVLRLSDLDDLSLDSYLTTPFIIGLNQPIFRYNDLFWRKKIAPLSYMESRKRYAENIEQLSITATNLFFALLIAQTDMSIAEKNYANNDTLYKIATGRYNLGKIAENGLLQMELSMLNSKANIAQAKLDLQTSTFELKNYLRIKDNIPFSLVPPSETKKLNLDYTIALENARKSRGRVIELDRKLLEADRDVARARGVNGINLNVFASYGLTSQTTSINGIYYNPDERQIFSLGIEVPILDWGRSKGLVEVAKANRELIRTNVEQDQISFEQEIFMKVMQFKILEDQLTIAAKSDTIAEKRYFVSKQRYLIGKTDITDLNIALNEKDLAKRS
ncbi:MAG: TolC family protein, partial [Bacteroidetes bacterium]|nr:TolC family protein [Bacteroidota bacterium]